MCMDPIKDQWENIKSNIRSEYDITDIAYNIWIKPLEFFNNDGSNIQILIPGENPEMKDYISRNYQNCFQSTFFDLMGTNYNVEFILQTEAENYEHLKGNSGYASNAADNSLNADCASSNMMQGVSQTTDLSVSNLNKKYHFENFVEGSNNKMAFSACLSVAESPGLNFNPLFIYGGSGLGKTHLITAIGHYIIENSSSKVLYVTSEDFVNEVVGSIRVGESYATSKKMRDKYRDVDVLLIDDIQFLINKPSTQLEFFHTFNTLINNGKAVVITSDKSPMHMKEFDDRIRTRFQSGLVVEITPPVYETRVAILQKYAESPNFKNITIPRDIIDYIASNIKSNVRELEGAYNKIYAEENLRIRSGSHITLDEAKEILKDLVSADNPSEVTPQRILEVVSDFYNINVEDITSKKRNQEIVRPRQVFMYLCREMTEVPLIGIAALLNKKEHTTVSHGINKIEGLLKVDRDLKDKMEAIKSRILSA